MRFNAHDYQRAAIDYVVEHPRCALFLDMGLGKTVITLSAIQDLALNRFEVSRVLVIAPLRVASPATPGRTKQRSGTTWPAWTWPALWETRSSALRRLRVEHWLRR